MEFLLLWRAQGNVSSIPLNTLAVCDLQSGCILYGVGRGCVKCMYDDSFTKIECFLWGEIKIPSSIHQK